MKPLLILATVSISVLSLSTPCRAQAEDDGDWQVRVTLGKDGWMHYQNARFGCALPIPPGMKALRPPDNGGGQEFSSLDGKVKITIGGSFNSGGNALESHWEYVMGVKDRTITYKKKTANWCVISGVQTDGNGFYERFAADKRYCAGWSISYPQADEKKYVSWIERMSKGFDPRFGKGADTVE